MDTTNKILTASDLIFSPAASTSVHAQLASIKRSSLSIGNRLRSLERDADWVRWVAAHYGRSDDGPSHYGGYDGIFEVTQRRDDGMSSRNRHLLPVIANERCGSWYIPPWEKTGGGSYWKSTDGHWGVWNFSLRRLNLSVIDVLQKSRAEDLGNGCGGAIVVDSTRQGKQLPDAFSKTAPIWCAVLNRLLFPEASTDLHAFDRCISVVSESEAAQIEAKLPSLVESARQLGLEVEMLRRKLEKPIRCFWVARGLGLMPLTPAELLREHRRKVPLASELDYHPLYLCMASEFQESATESSYSGYVQGAGDDAEAWAHGLTPALFWQHRHELLDEHVSEEDFPGAFQNLVTQEAEHARELQGLFRTTCTLANGHVIIGAVTGAVLSFPALTRDDLVIACSAEAVLELKGSPGAKLLHLRCGSGKLGSRALRKELDKIEPWLCQLEAAGHFEQAQHETRIFVACETGKDLSVGVALVLMCLYTDQEGRISRSSLRTKKTVDKSVVRQKLSIMTAAAPTLNPSRATLNSVNALLMKP